jgi:hypothetical protein
MIVPGVMTRTTSRSIRPRPRTGGVCSHTATVNPLASSRAMYGSAACAGKPHSGTSSGSPRLRAVRVRSSARDARPASS